ncbi:MAG: endonuclease domain-containing protein [Calditrichaeota bacterium]|nr:MAG: endonuclease domain-containing protein [Calditrichota bacterium]
MARNKIIPYKSHLKDYARHLRKNSTLPEIILWKQIKGKALGVEFHRQVPIDNFIVDFYCHELMLAIEIDGSSHDNKYEYDYRRETKLQDLGVKFIRFNNSDVMNNLIGVFNALQKRVEEIQRENS